jgi:hypothetical protein
VIEILIDNIPGQPAEFVASHGVGLHDGNAFSIRMSRNGRVQPKMIPSKSFTLGYYPKNIWYD